MLGYQLCGKIPHSELENIIFKHLGVINKKVILGPKIGEDAAILKIGSKVIIISTDPITGATKNIGWLSVHINANDVASYGIKPSWYLCSILLPENSDKKLIKEIMNEIDKACRELKVAVIGGHSEISSQLNRPIVIGTMLGETDSGKYVTSSGAKNGDKIIITKSVGLEGTAILASEFERKLNSKINKRSLKRAKEFIRSISIVKDALTAMKEGGVTSMHDPTEGGLINGLWEIAEASDVGLQVYESEIPITMETKQICQIFGIDCLRLMSSGSLLITSRPEKSKKILNSLERNKIPAFVIGEINTKKVGRFLLEKDGKKVKIKPRAQDELYKAMRDFAL
jgi:hydrogenase expression/formation protein HypE